MTCTALIVDVDGVMSAVHPAEPTWGDEVQAGVVFGPVLVSPSLCRRLEALAALPDVTAAWLTSWDAEMRASMDPWVGRDWPTVASRPRGGDGRVWWKQQALEAWLEAHPGVTGAVWCDDDLRAPSRRAAIRRRFARLKVELLLVAPRTEVGLSPKDLDRIEAWAAERRASPIE